MAIPSRSFSGDAGCITVPASIAIGKGGGATVTASVACVQMWIAPARGTIRLAVATGRMALTGQRWCATHGRLCTRMAPHMPSFSRSTLSPDLPHWYPDRGSSRASRCGRDRPESGTRTASNGQGPVAASLITVERRCCVVALAYLPVWIAFLVDRRKASSTIRS